MEMFLFRPGEHARLYNCSLVDVSSIPREQRAKPFLGAFYFLLGFTLFILYLPCLVVIWRHRADTSCYRLMLAMGLLDLGGLFCVSLYFGVALITGLVFCEAPTLVYVVGCFNSGFWASETTIEAVLALNRCLAMVSPEGRLTGALFGGRRYWFWVVAPLLYGVYFFLEMPPLLVCSMFASLALSPYAGYIPNADVTPYLTDVQPWHNRVMSVAIPAIYICFFVGYSIRLKWLFKPESTAASTAKVLSGTVPLAPPIPPPPLQQTHQQQQSAEQRAHVQKMIFIQILIIAVVNAVECQIYTYMVMNPQGITDLLVFVAQLFSIFIHGMPPVIYLALNVTIRRECLKLCKAALDRLRFCFSCGGVEEDSAVGAVVVPMASNYGLNRNINNYNHHHHHHIVGRALGEFEGGGNNHRGENDGGSVITRVRMRQQRPHF